MSWIDPSRRSPSPLAPFRLRLATLWLILGLFPGYASAQDECARATFVGIGTSGPYSNATATLSQPPWPCDSVGADIWFFFQVIVTQEYVFSTCGSATFDTVMEVFSGSCSNLVSLACNDDACGTLGSRIQLVATANTHLRIRVGGKGGATGRFSLEVGWVPHQNDECTDPTPLWQGRNAGYYNTSATPSMPPWPCASNVRDLWFHYVAECTGHVTFSGCVGSTYGMVIEVFDGTCGDLRSLGCSDYGCPGSIGEITVAVEAGRRYLVRAGGADGRQVRIAIEVSTCRSPPANDDCTGAIPLTDGRNGYFTNIGATKSSLPWACGEGKYDVWFQYAATCTEQRTLSTCYFTSFPTVVEVYEGTCSKKERLACSSPTCGEGTELTFQAVAGRTYWIRVGGERGRLGAFYLDITGCPGPPSNDECDSSLTLRQGINGPFSNHRATPSPGPSCGGPAKDVWFAYPAQGPGSITIDTCGLANFDTLIEAYLGQPFCEYRSSLACNDNACGGTGSRVTVQVTGGSLLYIRVAGRGQAAGDFRLRVTLTPPANDECSSAFPIETGHNRNLYTNGATPSNHPWSCGGMLPDVWYRFTAPCSAMAELQTCLSGSTDTVLEVFSGDCANLSLVGCSDDACVRLSSVSFPAQQGTDYWVRVGNRASHASQFALRLNYEGSVGGYFIRNSTQCGNQQLRIQGTPMLGGRIDVAIHPQPAGPAVIWCGLPIDEMLCPTIGCRITASPILTWFGGGFSVTVPCDPGLFGNSIILQGADLGVPMVGCEPVAAQIPFTPTDAQRLLMN